MKDTARLLLARQGRLPHVLRAPLEPSGNDTDRSYTLLEAIIPPGGGSIPHIHHREDEGFFVLESEVTILAHMESVTVGPGSFVNIPRHTLHYSKNQGSTVTKMLIMYGLAGFEHVFFETSPDVSAITEPPPPVTEEGARRFVEVAAFYGTEVAPPYTHKHGRISHDG